MTTIAQPALSANLDRRELLRAASLLALWTGLPLSALGQPLPDVPDCFIDAHCHIFNGKDIPAAQFVLNVAMRERDMADYAPVAAFFVRIIADFSPTHEAENGKLGTVPAPRVTDAEFKRWIYETLKSMGSNVQLSSTPIASPVFEDLKNAGFDIKSDRFKIEGQYASADAIALATLQRNYDPTRDLAPTLRPGTLRLPKAKRSSIEAFLTEAADKSRDKERESILDRLTYEIFEDVKKFFDGVTSLYSKLTAFMGVLRIFLSYRHENLVRIDAMHGKADPKVTRLYCSSLVDFDSWLGDEGKASTPLADQAQLMAKIARNAPANVLVHGFMPFDPLRAVIDRRRSNTSYEAAVKTISSIVESTGMLGVKVYPPMGFRAWGNKGQTQTYGDVIKPLLAKHGLTESVLSDEIDEALKALYKYCLDGDVPILTHASNSQTGFEGAGLRANPAYWRDLLNRPGYSRLRINLGHSGGVWCRVETEMGADEQKRCMAEKDWFEQIVNLVTAKDNSGQWAFPNVSFDIADILALNNAARRKKLVTEMKMVLHEDCDGRRARERMVYGTDWMFLAFDPDHRRFLEGARTLARDLPMRAQDLFWTNAADFLGLVEGEETATRLIKFYNGDVARQTALRKLVIKPRVSAVCG